MNQPEPRHDDVDTVELRIPCKAEWVAVARLAVAAVASRLHFTIEEIEDVKLAVAEACATVIQHASAPELIDIRCTADQSALRVCVRDAGRIGKVLASAPNAVDETLVGGLGVFLIRSLMDEVEYDVHPERGTNLVMVKRLTQ